MKCGKLTAKLRDAVPVCFIEEGKEIKRIKNIEIPDAIKELEYPYTDYTNYTDYTPYTRYTVNPGKTIGNLFLA